jgi:hypothetical protein
MQGLELVKGLSDGTSARPPYIPLLGEIALILGQVDEQAFCTDPQAQAVALAQTATALLADAITVGYHTDPQVGTSVVTRVRPLVAGRAVVACLAEADVAGVRAYCEAGVDMVLLVSPDRSRVGKFRTIANACHYYSLPVLLVDPSVDDGGAVATELGLDGAVLADPVGANAEIVGGGLSADSAASGAAPAPPRQTRFFWSFAGEVPVGLSPEKLASIGRLLTE